MNTGGPAFPTRNTLNDGMTLRDYFASKAMQKMLYSERVAGIVGVNLYEHKCAEDAYKVADAMLKARQA